MMFVVKWLRVLVAVVVFAALVFLFTDIFAVADLSLHHLAELQLVPLLLRGGFIGLIGVAVWLFVTFIFGRCYCSVICPYGILQDIISRIAKLIRRKKHKYSYRPAMPKTRGAILVLFVIGVVLMTFFGTATIVILLDPYSNFGRIAFSLFQPIVIFDNNLIAYISLYVDGGKSGFQPRAIPLFITAFIISVVMFLLMAFLSFYYGRRYCNVICPVGTLLGLVAKVSLFRVKLDQSKCIKCGLCEKACKGECIDSKNCTVDSSRCVACFNCFGVCRKNAVLYSLNPIILTDKNADKTKSVAAFAPAEIQHGRRHFLRLSFLSLLFSTISGGAMNPDDPYGNNPDNADTDADPYGNNPTDNSNVSASTLPSNAEQSVSDTAQLAESAKGTTNSLLPTGVDNTSRVAYVNDTLILPPGAGDLRNFQSKCTSCHLCVSKCPSRVLQPSIRRRAGESNNGGIRGLIQPSLKFDHHYCNRNCTVCGDVCPTTAIRKVAAADRELLKIGTVEFLIDNCIVHTQETSCGACQEHCSNGAIQMVPYGDPNKNLTIPEIHAEFCIGCGGCESICPVRPYRAIYIKGITEQTKAKLSYDPNEKQKTVDLEFI
ncbi:MAG: 4Fe-4S dicluster domain-containing protein [Planctomycetaceae bacterium]|jgi:formate hydrogenlyase subunit 6/NADH:ubiquinone oxidoreductase subunit I|nr:4Fe-4S dicluster domain-containing protein [Planctomycetaceae bacterium]